MSHGRVSVDKCDREKRRGGDLASFLTLWLHYTKVSAKQRVRH